MKPGAKYQLFVPADLAYGERGPGPISDRMPCSVFDVELVEVVAADADPPETSDRRPKRPAGSPAAAVSAEGCRSRRRQAPRKQSSKQLRLCEAWGSFPLRCDLLRRSRRLEAGDRQARSVAPKIFQAVEIAFFAVEDVHDHLQVIDHDPLTSRKTIDRRGTQAMIFAQSGFDLARNRFQMRLGSPRANDEEIGERGDLRANRAPRSLPLSCRRRVGRRFSLTLQVRSVSFLGKVFRGE